MRENIPFIQYLRPSGRKQIVMFQAESNLCKAADNIRNHGFLFACEVLTDDVTVSLTIEDEFADYAIEIVPNGPGVVDAVKRLIEGFDLAAALKSRKLNAN